MSTPPGPPYPPEQWEPRDPHDPAYQPHPYDPAHPAYPQVPSYPTQPYPDQAYPDQPYPPGGASPPGPPQPPPLPPPWYAMPRRRGRRPLQVGIALLAVGLALAIVGGVLAGTGSLGKIDHFSRVSVAQSSGTVHFDHAGGYLAYYESSTVSGSTRRIPLIPGVLVNEATGEHVVLDVTYGNRSDHKIKALRYSYHGHHGVAMWQFHIDSPGTWQVELLRNPNAAPDAVVAFGPSIAGGILTSAVLIVAGVLAFVAGAVLLIIGLVMQSRHRRALRRLAAAGPAPYAGGPYGAPPYAGGPHGAPPYQAQQPPPPGGPWPG